MKLHSKININGKSYKRGSEISSWAIYPFFMVHMLAFGASGFFMAYTSEEVPLLFLYLHGGFAILVYCIFYVAIFGLDQVKWMFINAALGCLGIYSQIDWVLGKFDKQIADYSFAVHVIPFLYFVLYTFLLRQAVLDFSRARENPTRQRWVEFGYVAFSLAFYLSFWFKQ